MPHGSPLVMLAVAYLLTAGAITAFVLGVRAFRRRALSRVWWLIALSYLGPVGVAAIAGPDVLAELLARPSLGDPTFVWVVPLVGVALMLGLVHYGIRYIREDNAARRGGR